MDADITSELLETLADPSTAKRLGKHIRTIRGIRGTPMGEVARTATAVWLEEPPSLPGDASELSSLFATAFEDGLVAIGLLAALGPEHPDEALDLGLDWLGRVDDVTTADALGWLVLGPTCLASGGDIRAVLREYRTHSRPAVRRGVAAMGLAALPVTIEGPASAPLRAKLQVKQLRFVDKPQSEFIATICTAFVKDSAPPVQKVLRRLLRDWTKADPTAVVSWASSIPGGLPRLLQDEVKRAKKKVS